MKLNSIKSYSILFFSILTVGVTTILYSCSNNDSNSVESINKLNSIEYRNVIYKPLEDGSVGKIENNSDKYSILLETDFTVNYSESNRNLQESYKVTNSETGEFFDVYEVVKHDNYYTFNVDTSSGHTINQLKYYGDDISSIFGNNTIQFRGKNENVVNCGPCVAIIVAAVVEIVDSLMDSPLEQCRGAMQSLNCPAGSSAYMQFSEGWFSTTCNVGCRR